MYSVADFGRMIDDEARMGAFRKAFAATINANAVVLDLESGVEKGRAAIPSPMQSVIFQAPGFGRDFYTCTFATLAHVTVAGDR